MSGRSQLLENISNTLDIRLLMTNMTSFKILYFTSDPDVSVVQLYVVFNKEFLRGAYTSIYLEFENTSNL